MKSQAFTLIELLIVVLIIAILASIALPNFMEFQTRAKISRVKADMRTLLIGLEAYAVDQGLYPPAKPAARYFGLKPLSTPIAYINNAYLPDPFAEKNQVDIFPKIYYSYLGRQASGLTADTNDDKVKWWLLISNGPNCEYESVGADLTAHYFAITLDAQTAAIANILGKTYDPTNGTTSNGDVHLAGGETSAAGPFFNSFFNR